MPKANVDPARRRDRPLRGRHQRRLRRDRLRHRLQHHVPVLRPRASSARPDNRIRLFKRMFKPGIDDLVFMGFAQATPTLFPFVEARPGCSAAYAVGRYRLPDADEMERVIDADEQKYIGHVLDRPRHTQQVDYFVYEHDLRAKEIPAGLSGHSAPGERHEVGDRPAAAARGDERRAALLRGARPAPAGGAASTSINIADISRARRRDPLGVLLLLREQGGRGGRADGGDVRRVRSPPPTCSRGDGHAGREHRGHDPRALRGLGPAPAPLPRDARRPGDQRRRARAVGRATGESFVPVVADDDRGRARRRPGARRARRRARWPPSCSSSTTGCSSGSPSAAGCRREEQVDAVVHIWLSTIYGSSSMTPTTRSPSPPAASTMRGLALRRRRDDTLAGPAGRPVVVMAHGLGGTKDSGLEPFAEGLAAAGLDVLAFDYRGFGASARASRARRCRWPARSRTTAPRWPRPRGCPASTRTGWCSGASRSPAATCSRPAPAATTSPRSSSLTPLVDGLAAGRLALAHHTPVDDRCARPSPGLRSQASAAAGDDADRRPARRGRRADPRRPLRGLPGDRRADLAQRDRRRRSAWSSAGTARASVAKHLALPAARADRRLRPQRPAARRGQGGVRRAAPRCGTTRATTSTCGRARSGSTRWSRIRSRSCGRVLAPEKASPMSAEPVLVTGACGLVGRATVRRLLEDGRLVVVSDLRAR